MDRIGGTGEGTVTVPAVSPGAVGKPPTNSGPS